jgi:hypothetical protein
MLNYLAIMVLCLSLTSCSLFQQFVNPRPLGMSETPDGSPIFKQGWEDGCETGLNAYGNEYYKNLHSFQQDPYLIHDPEYYRAWNDSYQYCRWYTWVWVRPWQGMNQ